MTISRSINNTERRIERKIKEGRRRSLATAMTAVAVDLYRFGTTNGFNVNVMNAVEENSMLDGDVLGLEFHGLFKSNGEQTRKKSKKKKPKKKAKQVKGKEKQKAKVDNTTESVVVLPPTVEVCANPSSFAVFAGVRQSVLEKRIRDAAQVFLVTNTSQLSDSEHEDDEEEKVKDVLQRIPKIVGIGLCSVFELIRESWLSYPSLCTLALEALLDILQGQQPEGLKSEPVDVIDSLFSLLLELASQLSSESKKNAPASGLTSVACSCLLSLVVARGETGKLLTAIAAMLMSDRCLATEDIKMPYVLTSLQRSVHAVLLGKTVIPDWITNGILKKGLIGTFILSLPEGKIDSAHYTMASDGQCLYIHTFQGNLFKIGTGYGRSIRGHLYSQRSDFYPRDKGWLGYAESRLFYKSSTSTNMLTVLDQESLKEVETVFLDGKDFGPSVTFCDGDNIGTITSAKDDSFVVRTYSSSVNQMPCISELPLKLARKCLDLFGWAAFDEEMGIHTITTAFDDEPTVISAGKEFALMRTISGKILYTGKAPSLGIKQGGAAVCRWVELPITKSPKIVQFSVGHEGLHALLVAEDGGVFFVGLARRGEDGDQSKGRRQPKPVKPKKMIKVESLNVVHTACNNGTSALITKEGELYMFGKDTTHCHHATGFVADLKDVSLMQVALGKAHVVALSNKGHVYTFGINNKGQCGRDFAAHAKDAIMSVAMVTANEEEGDDEELEAEDAEVVCPPGQHKWKQDECMVCTVCGECTGFGVSCISKGQPDRNPGLPCGCGWGDSGCTECGCCKTCAGENKVVDSILAAELDVIMRRKPGNRLPDQIQRKLDERRHRHKSKANSKSLKAHVKNIRTHIIEPPQDKGMIPSLVEDVVSSDPERETSKISSLAPARLSLSSDYPVSSVACGLHHTVLLLQNGEVFTFGSNQHGQLGVGDLSPRGAPVHVRLSSSALHAAAGSNHTVILTTTGLVYTFGSYQKGQLGRSPPQPHTEESRKEKSSREAPWFSVPGAVPNIGPKFGRRPTWVGASGDQTFLKIDESLINAHTLTHSMVVANKSCICLIPTVASSFKCLLINKADGSCRSFSDNEQVDLSSHSICIDPAYNIMWSFSSANSQMNCYNVVAAEAISPSPVAQLHTGLKMSYKSGLASTANSQISPVPPILMSTLATPVQPHYKISRSQAALHLLSCIDTLALAQELHWKVQEDETDYQSVSKVYNKEDFASVNRFESHGGGWGYSGHSIEAIRFMSDTDILLGGFGLFGGRGEYTGKIKLFDIGIEGGDQEVDGELLAETEEIPYECGARQKYPMLFDEPIALQANRWYVAWSRVSGPSSDCGSSGQCVITTEDQVAFYFKSSKKSNNGTDVNAGQIPQLLYKVITHESQTTNFRSDVCEPVYVLSREFPRTVTPDCLHSLLRLLEWSWQTFKTTLSTLCPGQKSDSLYLTSLLELEKLVYVSCSSLRLLRTYINEVYPNSVSSKKTTPEMPKLVECVVDTRSLLRRILSDPLTLSAPTKNSNNHLHKHAKGTLQEANTIATMAVTILEECHTTFVACFHAFYPTSFLKWTCLCDLLVSMESDPVMADGCDRLLAAILASLCSPTVKLTSILPIIYEQDDLSPRKQNPVPSSSSELSITTSSECKYPVLVEHMLHKTQLEEGSRTSYTFREVLNRLLTTIVRPVQLALGYEKIAPSSKLVSNTCGLLAAIIAELAAQTTGIDADLHSSGGRVLHVTPSRFTRTSQSRTWNTGNGSPDAICFSVDRPGIVIAGVTLYGGVGTYDYELELLDDQNSSSSDPSHTQRWNSLEIIRGTFGPDDCVGDVVEVKFDHPVSVKENLKYAIRLRNHGGRTSNGDGGLSIVKGPDSTTFTLSTCSLSFNGTNHTRGQLPQILYYSTPQDCDSQQSNRAIIELQARKSALSITTDIVKVATTLLQQARDGADEKVMDVLASAHVTSMLLPMVLAHIAPIATSDPRSAVQVLEMIQDVLPPVAHLNNRFHSLKAPPLVVNDALSHDLCTTSNHHAIVESEHPYKPATVATFKVCFPESVKWMSLEFDPQCGTAQSEDALQLYVPSQENPFKALPSAKLQDEDSGGIESPYWPVLHKFSGSNSWPRCSIILPGNEVLFSLETASDYVKDDKARFYGFKCLVVGYDWTTASEEGLRHLEEELAYLGGMCAASLMKRELLLPPVSVDEMEEDLDVVDDIANQVHNAHPNLLGKGFAISHQPSVHQALEGVLPFSYLSNERSFLRDFVLCAPGTSGGRLARWLQPDSYVDLKHCEVLYNKDEMRCGWPTVVTIVTKDQYEEIVNVPNLKLEVKAIPVDKRDRGVEDSNRKVPRMSQPDSLTFGGNPLPNIAVPYEVTVKDKMCYYAISMMKAYENYSFEELRYTTPALKRPSENMMVRANNDGTYSCNWTPGSVGWYLVHVSIDGFEIENSCKVEVKEPPQGVIPPSQNLVKKNVHQPNRARRFVAKYSAGLRIRAHPSLQSEQIGIVHVNGVVNFIDELHNDDGVWVRLSGDTIKKYCQNGYPEAWCLQYNQHLGRTLLVPLEEPKAFMEDSYKDNSPRRTPEATSKNSRRNRTGGPGIYHVVKCGASGHNIRSTPSLKAPPVGMLVLGNQLTVVEEIVNSDGSWINLDKDSMRRFCFNTDGEAWSLAQNKNDIVYLQHENDIVSQYGENEAMNRPNVDDANSSVDGTDSQLGGGSDNFWTCPTPSVNAVKPFDFSTAAKQNPVLPAFGMNDNQGVFTFGPSNGEVDDKVAFPGALGTPSFSFGSSAVRSASLGSHLGSPPVVPPKPVVPERRTAPNPSSKPTSVLQKWLRSDKNRLDQHHSSPARESNIPPELLGVSVKELVKVLGESRVNGNEATPPHSPPSTPPRRLSRSSSPKPPVSEAHRESSPISIPGSKISVDSTGSSPSSTRSVPASPQLSCSPVSSIIRPFRRGSNQSDYSSQGSPTPSGQSANVPLRRATTTLEICDSESKSFAQTGTQTSPDGSKGHFSIGTGSRREESIRLSPKMSRKDRAARQLRSKRERAQSPAPSHRDHGSKDYQSKEPVKTAMSPLVAECLRAVFAAFLWHEGIVHDAMACASFLKFHPDLPKQLPKVPRSDLPLEKPEILSKEQKARLRHSVEVSASNFLTIQPSTAEAFARSLANANVNKNKMPKPSETIKEEITNTAASDSKVFSDGARKINLEDKIASSPVASGPSTAIQSPISYAGSWTAERKVEGDLPPSLQHLLVLWEMLTSEILKMIAQHLSLPVTTISSRPSKNADGKDKDSDRKVRKKKEWRLSAVGRGNLFGEAAGPERETMCELCGKFFPHPVTYHMRQAHPGCGGHAGGKGYNSGGNFCGGWAGNCGDGGVGGSSWYLICDRCREKYLRQKRQVILKEKSRKNRKKMLPGKLLSPLPPMETHQIMKQNATFLLDLASASGAGMTSHQLSNNKRSPHSGASSLASNMPSLNEYSPLEPIPFPLESFQCLQMLGVQQMDSNLLSDNFLLEETLWQNRELGASSRIRSAEDGGVVTLHSLTEADNIGATSGFGSDVLAATETESPRGRIFHRSISVGTTTREWNREEGEGRIIMTQDGSSLLCHPSPTLTKLVALATDKSSPGEILGRPILAFILQRHDLQSLSLAMKQAVRKAACRAYAVQGLNWLIRSVTQPTALHDLLWFFVAALTPPPDPPEENEEDESSGEKKERREPEHQEKEVAVCDHPLSDITIAGEAVRPLVTAFHTLLQSISDLMMMLPMGSALQQMAMRCWCLKFRQSDHVFLHRSHVFSNISKILSRSEEELCGDGDGMSSLGDSFQSTSIVECLKDLTSTVDLKASSRPGMLGSLIDNSTETFWESGDEDRNKTKVLTMTCSASAIPRMVYVHVDNCRDLGNKVSNIAFKVGLHVDEFVKLKQLEVESRYTGWVSCPITEGRPSVIRLELKGPDNTLRVRQVKVLGEVNGESLKVGKVNSAFVIQQRNCEAETLKVFRLLTSQVFGKLISSDEAEKCEKGFDAASHESRLDDDKAEGNNDLKEHMVGILFSRSKLTHLQKQVCAHIVQAIRKEAARVRDEWEALLCSKSLSMEELPKSSDAYCFEMLSMVLALSGSSVGRAYLAQQCSLLTDLLSLLHTGSARVQRQVTSLLRRVLPEVSPQTFAQILGVNALPPSDYSIVSEVIKITEAQGPHFDIHRMGILDVFFSCIAKALTVQMKVKGKETNKGITTLTLATSIHPRDFMGARWWLRGCITRKLAEVIIQLLQDMAAGKLSEAWANITKGAVAENILNLTKLEERCRTPSDCLKTPTLWLALSSLCVLDQDHVERLSSGQWAGTGDGQQSASRPICDNHDDGETLAIILCSACGNLCADCDRYLHLHRRTHSHQRQVFKEEEEAIKVDLHEGCGRTKLFWIMALADSKTLKAMVEFREGAKGKSTTSAAGTCRFCGAVGETGLLAIGNVCGDAECQEHARSACIKSLSCGHMCGGIRNEVNCLPCLHGCSNDPSLKQDADDMCMICFTEALSCAPALQLSCGHIFHLHCCRSVLMKRWAGPRITFSFSLCPICKATIDHLILKELLEPVRTLFDDVRRKALMRLEYEGLHKAEAITTPGARFYTDPAGYAMERYAYYVCYKCNKAYFGGEARCDIEAGGGDDYDPAELVCGACSDVSRAQMCPKHGTDFLEYKCRYCCSVAVFFCFGTTHFCNACHDDFQHVTNIPKHELSHCPAGPKGKQLEGDECPLHIQHPPTGEEFALGCGVCRNAHTF